MASLSLDEKHSEVGKGDLPSLGSAQLRGAAVRLCPVTVSGESPGAVQRGGAGLLHQAELVSVLNSHTFWLHSLMPINLCVS